MGPLDDIFKTQQDAQSMSTPDLEQAYQQSYSDSMRGAPPAETDAISEFANLIADRPGDSVNDIDQREDDADAAAARQQALQRMRVYEDELKRRGLKPDWSHAEYASIPIVPDDGPAPPPTSTPVDPHLDDPDTGHYDDGHSFGWKQADPQPPAPSADPHLDGVDTGHYDDGHSFGWKQASASPPAPVQRALPLPGWLLGAIGAILLVIAAVGFAAARGGSTPASSVAPSANAIGAAGGIANAAPNAPGVICDDAPALSLTLSGAAAGTVTKGCVPKLAHPGQQASPATPYCRLQGIPNPPHTVSGVLAVGIAFVNGSTRYEVTMSYVADNPDPINHGALPATVVIDPNVSPAGVTSMQSWPATNELPGTQGTLWNPQTGTFTFTADGASGTVDMTYKSVKDGSTLNVKGDWHVAGGCPAVGK